MVNFVVDYLCDFEFDGVFGKFDKVLDVVKDIVDGVIDKVDVVVDKVMDFDILGWGDDLFKFVDFDDWMVDITKFDFLVESVFDKLLETMIDVEG